MARAQNSSPLVVTLAVSAVLILVWQSWVAGRNGMSDVYARPAISYLEDKVAAEPSISEAEWHAVHESISRADELMPGNPRYLDSLGWLEQIKLGQLTDSLDIEQVDAHARAAENYYRGAIAARPTWPYYWGSLALEEYRRGNYDADEYSVALANAARFGPWKDDTQRLVADLGSDTLEFLSPRARREVLLNVERGLSRQPDAMLEIVYDWELVCETANVPDVSLPLLSSRCEQIGDQLQP
jgi:hypothetical protein